MPITKCGRRRTRYVMVPINPKTPQDFRYVVPDFQDALETYIDLRSRPNVLKEFVTSRQKVVEAVEKVRDTLNDSSCTRSSHAFLIQHGEELKQWVYEDNCIKKNERSAKLTKHEAG